MALNNFPKDFVYWDELADAPSIDLFLKNSPAVAQDLSKAGPGQPPVAEGPPPSTLTAVAMEDLKNHITKHHEEFLAQLVQTKELHAQKKAAAMVEHLLSLPPHEALHMLAQQFKGDPQGLVKAISLYQKKLMVHGVPGVKIVTSPLVPKDQIYIMPPPTELHYSPYLEDVQQQQYINAYTHPQQLGVYTAPAPVSVHHQSGKDDWGTPWDFYLWVDAQFHLTLDVCATWENTKCKEYLTPEMNGKNIDWWGRVWMNPPYSEVREWIDEMVSAIKTGEIELGVALVAARPDTKWWWHAVAHANEVWFLKGRLQFEGATSGAPFPSALLIFRPQLLGHTGLRHTRFVDWRTDNVIVY